MPPNLLVADGAAEFAVEHGMSIVHHDALVSDSARERFFRWREDLRRAGLRHTPSSPGSTGEEVVDLEYEEKVREKQRQDHFNSLMSGIWRDCELQSSRTPDNKVQLGLNSQNRGPGSTAMHSYGSPAKRPRYSGSHSSDGHGPHASFLSKPSTSMGATEELPRINPDTPSNLASPSVGKQRKDTDGSADDTEELHAQRSPADETRKPFPAFMLSGIDEDRITDTVGAIAIDMFGNIAAGSSSGGIGMKHRGRVGPAALVGVGTAVFPADSEDPDDVTVAAVISGTGEHMATTMASQKCAERLYFCTKHGPGNTYPEVTEEEAMEAFVTCDFMGHPGVKNSNSAGAIGVMAVKKAPGGYFLHFAHNTDSFALASMHSGEKDPKCVMSRVGDKRAVVQGGRKIRAE